MLPFNFGLRAVSSPVSAGRQVSLGSGPLRATYAVQGYRSSFFPPIIASLPDFSLAVESSNDDDSHKFSLNLRRQNFALPSPHKTPPPSPCHHSSVAS